MISARIHQRFDSLLIRKNRIQNRSRTNTPFLSGDGFAELCDISVFPPKHRGKAPTSEDISNAQSIFCPSDRLESLLEIYGETINATVLVLGNSDRDFFETFDLPKSIQRVFLQNSHISNSLFKTLPIGIENIRWGKNGFPNLFSEKISQAAKKDAVLVGPFSPTHPERKELEPWKLISHEQLATTEERLRPAKLALLTSRYRYIACPRGNGTDTHRFWETLYRGSIPVIKESRWSNSIRELGLPILELREWNFEEFLEKSKNLEYMDINPRIIPELWLSFWQSQFRIQS